MIRFVKRNYFNIILFFLMILGLCLLLYPSFSNYWNSFHQSKTIAGYMTKIENLDTNEAVQMMETAEQYNRKLLESGENKWKMTVKEKKEYEDTLDVSGTGIMGYIDIPQIKVSLPIYHTVDESILQVAVGHLPGSSFPVGGKGTHCALSGHRGLPSALLFTNLDRLVEGDLFVLNVLEETMTYEVDKISIVEPDDTSELIIEKDKDLCTLITCTPYGINTHRLLVRGHRVENQKGSAFVTSEATLISPNLVAQMISVPVIFILLMTVFLIHRKS